MAKMDQEFIEFVTRKRREFSRELTPQQREEILHEMPTEQYVAGLTPQQLYAWLFAYLIMPRLPPEAIAQMEQRLREQPETQQQDNSHFDGLTPEQILVGLPANRRHPEPKPE